MAPPAKKRRADTAAAAAASAAAAAAAAAAASAAAADLPPSPTTPSAASIQNLLSQTDEATQSLCKLLETAAEGSAGVTSSDSAAAAATLLAQSSAAFLTLKSTQRQLCLTVESNLVNNVVSQAREEVGAKTLELQNLVYERDYLRGRVRECRDYGCGQLVKMARDEIGTVNQGEEEGEGHEGHEEEEEEGDDRLINAFLSRSIQGGHRVATGTGTATNTYDHRDPSHHGTNLSHLKTELTLRRTTETELTKARAELAELKKLCASRKAFLASLPRKLREVERSTGPLQNFFREAVGLEVIEHASDSDKKKKKQQDIIQPTMLIGTDRTARIEAARSLPEPLYTIFLQLNGYLDAFASATSNIKIDVADEAASGEAAAVTTTAGDDATNVAQYWILRHDKVVVLTMPIPDIEKLTSSSLFGSSSTSPVTIKFCYLPRLGVVTAAASGSGDDGRMLLSGLFPNDDGTTLPSCAAPFLVGEKAVDGTGGGSSNPATATAEALAEVEALLAERGDLPYRWCQFIAGLIFPPSSHSDASAAASGQEEYHDQQQPKRGTIEPSTRSVVRALTRRIRARTTLTALLNMLGRCKVPPVHAALNGDGSGGAGRSDPSSRLTGWSEKRSGGADETCKYYVATVKHGNGSTLKTTVKIDPAYPAIPPLWSLQPATANLDEEVGAQGWGEREGTAISLHNPTSVSGASSPPLYDPIMGSIEDAINADLESLVVDGVEDTYDWILSAQVDRLLECFDSVQEVGSAAAAAGAGLRLVSYELYAKGF